MAVKMAVPSCQDLYPQLIPPGYPHPHELGNFTCLLYIWYVAIYFPLLLFIVTVNWGGVVRGGAEGRESYILSKILMAVPRMWQGWRWDGCIIISTHCCVRTETPTYFAVFLQKLCLEKVFFFLTCHSFK
jgi:hypothetical protein